MATSTYNSFFPGYYNFLRQRAGLSGTQVRPEDLEALVRADLDARQRIGEKMPSYMRVTGEVV